MASRDLAAERHRRLVLGVNPFGQPNPRMVASVCRAGALGVLDLGAGDRQAREALQLALRWSSSAFGVRVGPGCALGPDFLTEVSEANESGVDSSGIDTILLSWDAPWHPADLADLAGPAESAGRFRVLVEVTSRDEALWAKRVGAHGVVARGSEAGGRVGQLSSFVLLQQLLADSDFDLPVWVCGGVGVHTAPAAVAGGAAGVVLDSQLCLLDESDVAEDVAAVVRAMDGSETVLVDGHRVLRTAGTVPTVPIGQDGFLAGRYARQYGSADVCVRAIRDAITGTVVDGAGASLATGSALCRALGVDLPIVQGPMTRVSDRAEFAAAVARNGAMPMLALALAAETESRALLERTRRQLGDRPWGVGILGFAPEDVRAAQLALIRELRPSCVIIAGGRPSQARALEGAGISTFLHVPSPGLLRQFLDAGARRFVFEGSECGGHVGPRSSFPLWEAQLAVLDDVLAEQPGIAADLHVLFAGGIHDERSAAMVAAMAAPLAARGAGFGLLMGTAYLFTEEAVDAGAVGLAFQQQVVHAERTELLETAPGHATRCVSSAFSEHFTFLKDDLRARGLPDREVWEELERLNVGRLRIASKGVRRQGADLVEVDEPTQLAEGLFMAGDVVVLRSATTTIATLHQAVTSGAARFLGDRTSQLREECGHAATAEVESKPFDVAIVGMACVFPQAANLDEFWSNVVLGADAVTEVPAERWDTATYYSADAADSSGERTPSKWGGFLPPIPFDPFQYGIPPASLRSIEPTQLLALEVSCRALADAGYADTADRSRVSVVFGADGGSDLSHATVLRTILPSYLGELPDELAGQLPTLTEDSFPGLLANVIAGRVANRLDLGGTNYTVDAACASSLAAVDVACKELVAGSSDMVLCGAADLHNSIHDYLLFSSVRALSPTGRCRTFDSSADGIVLGEGVACVALKRLADAERDGDRIYAVIKGVGSASDGRSLGLTAPRAEGQRAALERAYRGAGVSPAEAGLVEAHGTGTVVGDRTELGALTEVFADAGAGPASCALGSVKSQIGHTKCAAGLAGLIKATMALHTGVTPPTLHVTAPNQRWSPESSPFAFFPHARPWTAPPERRVAGVSAFGFGGTNFHVVLQGHKRAATPRHSVREWPAELFTFRGADLDAAQRSVTALLKLVQPGSRVRLRDLALWASRKADAQREAVRIAIVASTVDELADLLRRALAGEQAPGLYLAEGYEAGKLAMLFPGQGSQRTGMLAELFVSFPELHRFFPDDPQWTDLLFPPAAFGAEAADQQQARLRDTRSAQPALGVTGLAMHELFSRLGVVPDMLGGHSYGELVALCAAGAMDAATLLRLSSARAQAMVSVAGSDPGAMAAVAATAADVEQVLNGADLSGNVIVANHNAPRQAVISGPTELVDRAVRELRDAGHAAKRISVACAFHSPLIAGAAANFASVLSEHELRATERPVWANRTAEPYEPDGDGVRAELAAQLAAPVQFVRQIEAMYAAGARVFLEAGPGTVLGGLVDQILRDRPHRTVSVDATPGLRGFLCAAAQLAVAGVPLRTGWLFAGRGGADPAAIEAGKESKQPGWTVDGHTVRTADGEYLPGGLAPARRVREIAMTPQNTPADPQALISEYLRTSREMVAAQRDVMLSFLGAQPAAVPPVTIEPRPVAESVPEPAAAKPGTAAPDTAEPGVPAESTVDVTETVVRLIAERTGYPADMIDAELDLETDLSVDSIKRTEIAGELARRCGIGASADGSDVDELARLRSVRAIVEWMSARAGGEPDPAAAGPSDGPAVSPGEAPRRFVLEWTPQPADRSDPAQLAGTSWVVLGRGPVTEELTEQLAAHGAAVSTDSEALASGGVDGVVYLAGLSSLDDPALPEAVPLFQAALGGGLRWLLAAVPADPHIAALGLRGFFRTVAREYPGTRVRLVEVPDPSRAAASLIDEALTAGDAPVVSTVDRRRVPRMVESPVGLLASTGAGPAEEGAAEVAAAGLDRESVILLVGGARGITARVAIALAAATRCRIELVGRTELPAEPEPPAVARAGDLPALRRALAELRPSSPAEIDRSASRILAQREIARTLDELSELGSAVRYHAVDARDPDGMEQLVKEIHAEQGRLDGVFYAAGIIEDRLLADKDEQSFRRVFGTKVDGARALLAALDGPRRPEFVVLFGSIAAVLGNRGQADYAAANDALEPLAAEWSARTGRRALTVHWGPWAPGGRHGGMVSTDLAASYARRGIALIDPAEGTLALLRELAWGSAESVIYTASGWGADGS